MTHYGLIGYPLEHSRSKVYFTKKFAEEHLDADYQLYPLSQIEELEKLRKEIRLRGLNVTMPYKEAVIEYLDEVDEAAKEIGAVNVIRFADNGQAKGYNTDYIGFRDSLVPLLGERDRKALILGSGGAAKAVEYALRELAIEPTIVSRSKERGIRYDELTKDMVEGHSLIINATPLGMVPNSDKKPPFPYEWIPKAHLLYDLIYAPEETLFLQEGLKRGCRVKNGTDMLIGQAEAAWRIWNR